MKHIYVLITLLLLMFSFSSCAYKRYAKKGAEFESQGMYQEATDMYYQSLISKPTHIESQMGLKRTGQRVVDNMYSNFMTAYNQGNNKEAVYHYLEAKKMEDKIKSVGINLTVPPYYSEYYSEVKSNYLEDRYFKAINKLNEEDFSAAREILSEIVKIDASYKDSKDKLLISIYEPKYRQANEYMGYQKYRSAYYLFDEIIRNYGDYKGSIDLKAEAQRKATIRIAIEDFQNYSGNTALNNQLKSKIINGINQSEDPFLQVIEYNPKASYQSSKTIQPDAIVKGSIHNLSVDLGRLSKEEKRGYLEITSSFKDSEGNTQTKTSYKKVTYDEFFMKRSVSIKFDMTMVDTRNNAVLVSKSINLINSDQIHYADYEGKKEDLVPGYWKNKLLNNDEDVIENSRRDRQALQELLNGRKQIRTIESLKEELIDAVSDQTVNNILKYNPEK
jgi:hypothetical protein